MKLLPLVFLLFITICFLIAINRHRQVQCDLNEKEAKALLQHVGVLCDQKIRIVITQMLMNSKLNESFDYI